MTALRTGVLALSLAAAVLAIIVAVGPQYPFKQAADIIYCYDSITTLTGQSSANCFTVSEGKFSRVFENRSDEFLHGRGVVRNSGVVIPGLWDGHGHILGYGELLRTVDLFGSKSLADVNDRIKNYLIAHPVEGTKEEWIRGNGWDQASFGRMPIAGDFEADPALKGKYIMLNRVDSHCMWVSQAVLDLLPNPIPDTPGGEVITKPGKGVFCDNAMDLVVKHYPKPSKAKLSQFLGAALKELHKVGLVGVHDASVLPSTITLFEDLIEKKEWTLRVYAMLECPQRNTFCPEVARKIQREDGLLTVRSVKLFGGLFSPDTRRNSSLQSSDGALGSWGSAMLEPYSDHPDSIGSLLVNGSALAAVTRKWAEAGYQVNIHAIGDRANRLVIDAFSKAYPIICPNQTPAECQSQRRFRIEHSQIIHPDDQKRIFDLGIIPSVQPTHATSDMAYAEDRLGSERTAKEAYRMKSFLPLQPVLGSDFPVEPPNPLHGMYAAVTRKNPSTGLGRKGHCEGWYTEEALTLDEALRGFTVGPARAAFLEGKAGVITEGAFADWVVLDEALSAKNLRDSKVRETWVGGERVYARA
jgi:predicted amidohydrolase YtcJ